MKCKAAVAILASEGLALGSVSRQHARKRISFVLSWVVNTNTKNPPHRPSGWCASFVCLFVTFFFGYCYQISFFLFF